MVKEEVGKKKEKNVGEFLSLTLSVTDKKRTVPK